MLRELLPMSPYLVSPIWGGTRLSKLKGLSPERIGETWEVSDLLGKESTMGGAAIPFGKHPLSYLIKFIDTSEHLSIQVHPDDAYAARVEKSSGKTECWLILEAGPDAGIYLGLRSGVTKEMIRRALEEKTDVSLLLEFHPVQSGDFFFVPAGTAHSIGKDVFLLEVQQSSGITYRLWDWNRVDALGKGRELHLEKGLDVLNMDSLYTRRSHVYSGERFERLVDHPDFIVERYLIDASLSINLDPYPSRPKALVALQETLLLHRGEETLELKPYHTALLPWEGHDIVKIESSKRAPFIWVS